MERSSLRFPLLLAMGLSLAGCATSSTNINLEELKRTKTIRLVVDSNIGNSKLRRIVEYPATEMLEGMGFQIATGNPPGPILGISISYTVAPVERTFQKYRYKEEEMGKLVPIETIGSPYTMTTGYEIEATISVETFFINKLGKYYSPRSYIKRIHVSGYENIKSKDKVTSENITRERQEALERLAYNYFSKGLITVVTEVWGREPLDRLMHSNNPRLVAAAKSGLSKDSNIKIIK